MEVTIYSTKMCATCNTLTKWLDDKSITYTKKVVDEDPDAMTEFMSVNDGAVGVPFTLIKDEEQTHKISGFEKAKFESILE